MSAPSKIPAIKTLVKFLEKVYGAVGDFMGDENSFARCLYFQDLSMKDMLNFYPDRVCINFNFKRFEIDIFMYTFLCEDSNGRNYIIAVGFLQKTDIESLTWLISTFKKHNPNWRKIKSIAVDPGIKSRELVRDSFPHPLIITCFFHAFAAFRNDINIMKGVSDEHKISAIALFKKLFYAPSVSEFEICYQQYLDLPEILVSYMLENWMTRQQEWRIPLDFYHENIFLNLNSFLEELNNTIKSLFDVENNFIEFIKKIFLIVSLKKKEKPSMFLQPVSFLYSRFSPEYQISKALTPYAAQFVIQQLDLSSEVSTDINGLSDTYIFGYLGMSVSASATACSCHFFLFTMLPCRHIFAVRKINYFCAFDESLIDYTWNMKYYEHTLACMQGYLHHNTDSCIPQDASSRAILSSHLFEISVPQLLELPKDVFNARFEVLKKLVHAWKMDDDISLQFIGTEKSVLDIQNVNTFIPGPSSVCTRNEDASCYQGFTNLNETKDVEHFRNSGLARSARKGLLNFNSHILNSEHINLSYIFCIICTTKETCVEWLRSMGFIASSMKCPSCKSEMMSKTIQRLSDGVVWSCPKIGMSTSGYYDPLDRWLQKHVGEDSLIQFLKDAAYSHQRDTIKNVIGTDKM